MATKKSAKKVKKVKPVTLPPGLALSKRSYYVILQSDSTKDLRGMIILADSEDDCYDVVSSFLNTSEWTILVCYQAQCIFVEKERFVTDTCTECQGWVGEERPLVDALSECLAFLGDS